MEKSHKSMSLFKFQQRFTSDNQCRAYLAAEKWKNGYACSKCGHTHYCQGNTLYSRQCTRCKKGKKTKQKQSKVKKEDDLFLRQKNGKMLIIRQI